MWMKLFLLVFELSSMDGVYAYCHVLVEVFVTLSKVILIILVCLDIFYAFSLKLFHKSSMKAQHRWYPKFFHHHQQQINK